MPDEKSMQIRAAFLQDSAPKLVQLIQELNPTVSTVEARQWNAFVGIFIGSKREEGEALFAFPLNAFIQWHDDEMARFLADEDRQLDAFRKKLPTLVKDWIAGSGVDVSGGSQRDPITQPLWLYDFGI